MKKENCLTMTMCSLKVQIIIRGGKAPECNLKSCDEAGQNHLDQRVDSVAPPPGHTHLAPSPPSPPSLPGPDVVQPHLQENLHEGNQEAVDHPDVHHLHTGGFWQTLCHAYKPREGPES